MWALMRPPFPSLPTSEYQKAVTGQYSPGSPYCYPSRLNTLPEGKVEDERYRCEQGAEENRLKSDDLVQQTRAATAAIALVDLTYRQTLMGLAATIFGLLTLIAAAFAAWYAKHAADAGRTSNRIAQDAQRPWIAIDAELTEFIFRNNIVRFSYIVRFTNTGQTVAEKFWSVSSVQFAGEDHPAPALAELHRWRRWDKEEGIAIMPGETVVHEGTVSQNYNKIKWEGESGNRRIRLVVSAAAYYQIPGADDAAPLRFTERTFLVGQRHSTPGRQLHIPEGRFASFDPKNAVYRRTYPSLTS